MAQNSRESDLMRATRRFLQEVELGVRAANRKVIGKMIPSLDREAFLRLALAVARLRASYLEAVMGTNWEDPSPGLIELRKRREIYEEALRAFDALERSIERGYVAIDEKPKTE